MAKPNRLLLAIQEVLIREWDPLGVKVNEHCRNEYDSYASSLFRSLRSGADEIKIAAQLGLFQRSSMGLSVLHEELDREVARRLVALAKQRRRNRL
jgi:hypothetical protein